jgi:hypothetical protein
MARFQTVIKSALFVYSPYNATEMQGFAQVLADPLYIPNVVHLFSVNLDTSVQRLTVGFARSTERRRAALAGVRSTGSATRLE